MKNALFLTAALALSLSAGGAYAQPSQAQGGGQTSPTSNPPGASDATRNGGTGMVGSGTSGMSGSGTTGSGMSGSTSSTNTTATNPAGPSGAGPTSTSGATGTNNR